MKKSFFAVLLVPVLVGGTSGYGSALETVDFMRCGSNLVQVGDNKVDILSKCGEPALRQKVTRGTSVKKSKAKRGTTVTEHTREDDQWTYNFGPQDFLYTLSFEGVELKNIGRGGRGTRR